MIASLTLLILSAALIYVACEYFVNGIEWLGDRLGVSQTAVGTVLAAFGTALPESVVTFVAVVFGRDAGQRDIGIGAALGGPLVLGTLAYAVVGVALLVRHRGTDRVLADARDVTRLQRDQRWFLAIFILKVLLGLIAFANKSWFGLLFLLAYALYTLREMRNDDELGAEDFELEPLKLRPRASRPSTLWVLFQTGLSLCVIFASSQVFVHELTFIGPGLGLPPQLVALLLSPIATELPETMNAIIWVRQGKISLALGNISGSMMIQATVPSALGLIFTPWLLDTALLWAGGVTMLSIVSLQWLLGRNMLTARRLAGFALFYVLFAAGLAVS